MLEQVFSQLIDAPNASTAAETETSDEDRVAHFEAIGAYKARVWRSIGADWKYRPVMVPEA